MTYQILLFLAYVLLTLCTHMRYRGKFKDIQKMHRACLKRTAANGYEIGYNDGLSKGHQEARESMVKNGLPIRKE